MPIIESRVLIDGKLDDVYQTAKDIEKFPEFMEDVTSVKIVGHEGENTVISDWVGEVKQFRVKMKWTEKDIWDDINHTCDFSLVKGDYTKYGGKWIFREVDGQTEFYSSLDYEYNVPMIGPIIKKVVAKKMQENLDNILNSVKKKVEGS